MTLIQHLRETDAQPPEFLIAAINAIGEVSKQEAVDAICREWPHLMLKQHVLRLTAASALEAKQAALDAAERALHVAVETIRTWHGMGMPEDLEESAWELYQQSPEMQRINAAREKLQGVAA